MPAPGGRRGRRDNGLVAAEYVAAGDIDPRIGEHLLDVLAIRGIAAYLQPSTDLHPITRTTTLPSRPTDRLFVDRVHLATARDYLRRVNDELDRPSAGRSDPPGDVDHGTAPDRALDAAWEEVIAGFNLTIDPTEAPWPRSEDIVLDEPRLLPRLDRDAVPAAGEDAASDPDGPYDDFSGDDRRHRPEDEPSLLDALDTFGAGPPDDADDDEGYTPPPPPPLPRISTAAGLGVAAIAVGFVLFIWPDLLPASADTVLLLAFSSIVAGFVTLIWRLRPGDDEDGDGDDDGARV